MDLTESRLMLRVRAEAERVFRTGCCPFVDDGTVNEHKVDAERGSASPLFRARPNCPARRYSALRNECAIKCFSNEG